jgi:hypothetical protein
VRQGQQNRRGRGRNRKNHNPLSRSFESNGPDVKIRGTPAHIAEKYLTLARDAQSSGDPVLAENYLQHAEHYSRIIMAYREQLHQPGEGINGNGQRLRGEEGGDDFGEDEGDEMLDEAFPTRLPHQQAHSQPGRPQGGGYEGGRHDRGFRRDHNRFRDRHNDRDRRNDNRGQPSDRQPEQSAEGGSEPRRRDRGQQQVHEQPEFLRRPVRRARNEGDEPEAGKEESSD